LLLLSAECHLSYARLEEENHLFPFRALLQGTLHRLDALVGALKAEENTPSRDQQGNPVE